MEGATLRSTFLSAPARRPYIIPIFISQLGCPFQCLYCQQESITGQKSQLPSVEAVVRRIEAFLQTRKSGRYTHTEVAFYGGTFTGLSLNVTLPWLRAASDFIKRGAVQSLRASTKPDLVDLARLEPLKPYGLTTIELGVQSMDNAVLQKTGRGYDEAKVKTAVQVLKNLSLAVGAQLMPGLPGADEAEAYASAAKTIALKPDFVRIYPTVVLENTALASLYRRGEYKAWSLEQAIRVCRRLRALFARAQIPIIKMGLEFSGQQKQDIIAGPYHPSFRQCVERDGGGPQNLDKKIRNFLEKAR